MQLDNEHHVHLYATFFSGEKEVAIDTSLIREVVNSPSEYISIPGHSNYFLGMIKIRNSIVPVLDIKKFYADVKTSDKSSAASGKIIILISQGIVMGLWVDKVGDVLRCNPNEVIEKKFIDSVSGLEISNYFIRLKKDIKAIQVIDPIKLIKKMDLNLENLGSSDEEVSLNVFQRRGKVNRCISFELNGSVCGIEIKKIKEITTTELIQSCPIEDEFCMGMMRLRGETIPVFKLASFFDNSFFLANTEDQSRTFLENERVILIDCNDGVFGVIVSQVNNIVAYYDDEITCVSKLLKSSSELYSQVISKDQGIEINVNIFLLSSEKFALRSFVKSAVSGLKKLYPCQEIIADKEAIRFSQKTFLTFNLVNTYAFDIAGVYEIIERPSEIMKADDLPANYLGVINVRGSLVQVVDTPKLYGLKSIENKDEKNKIIIFKIQDQLIGFVVYSVIGFLNINTADKDTTKGSHSGFLNSSVRSSISEDVSDKFYIDKGNDKTEVLTVLSLEKILSRLRFNLVLN